MGAVYRATQLALGRSVAIKLIRPDRSRDPTYRDRFLQESRRAASIDHANVIPIYEAGEDRGLLYIAMRFVEGKDLAEEIAENGPLVSDELVPIFDQLCSALESAHLVGLVHRDLKPANVLLAGHTPAHVYLTDFGVATRQNAETAGGPTQGDLVGTVDYMSPEQILGRPVAAQSDIYALGGVLFTLITGEAPYPRDSLGETLLAHVNAPPPSVRERGAVVGAEVDRVITRAMAKTPAERHRSARELAEDARQAFERDIGRMFVADDRQATRSARVSDGRGSRDCEERGVATQADTFMSGSEVEARGRGELGS